MPVANILDEEPTVQDVGEENEDLVHGSVMPTDAKKSIADTQPQASESEGFYPERSYNVIEEIAEASSTVLNAEIEEEVTEEEDVEEEEISEQSVRTYDCLDEGNNVEIVYDGYRETGVTNKLGIKTEEKCKRVKSIIISDADEFQDVEWVPTLKSAFRKEEPGHPFTNIKQLKHSINSSKTHIFKTHFDSVVLLGLGKTPIERYTLCNDFIEVDIINFGATVTAVRLFEDGKWIDVALGFDNVAAYLDSGNDCMGGTTGRVTNIIKNAKFNLPNKYFTNDVFLSKNFGDNHMNGGFRPLHKRLWEAKRSDDQLVLSCKCYDGEDGYPGNLTVWALFCLTGDYSFNVEYYAETDTTTPVNISNCVYFNLAGHDAGCSSLYDHSVFVNSELCYDSASSEEDRVALVYQTPFNLTDLKHFGCVMKEEGNDGIDVTFALYKKVLIQERPTDPVQLPQMIVGAVIRHQESRRTLVVYTDQWALRLYTCNKFKNLKGKGKGTIYGKHAGFCIQTGNLPNAVNVGHFPSPLITPYEPYRHRIRYVFTTASKDMIKKQMFINRKPWAKDDIYLSCDQFPKSITKEPEEIETEYQKTYKSLEKLATQTSVCKGDEYDSLSLHSSFTSFGSSPEKVFENLQTKEPQEQNTNMPPPEIVEPEQTPEIVVKQPVTLPPYLTGKWPNATPRKKVISPEPAKKECVEKTKPQRLSSNIKKHSKFTNKQICRPDNDQIYKVEPTSYKTMKVGVIDRVDKNKLECEKDAKFELPAKPDTLDFSESSIEYELNSVKNTVAGNWCFQWFEPPELLPWYASNNKPTNNKSFLPEDDRKKQMGTLFKMINFPEDYALFDGTEDELMQLIKLKLECMKNHYNSITIDGYSNGETVLNDDESLSDSDF